MEAEPNDAIAGANTVNLTPVPVGSFTHLQATVAGAVTTADGGDFYQLGNLTAATAVTLALAQPSASPLQGVLAILDGGGNVVATSPAGAASLGYTVPAGQDGTYYARVTAANGSAGLLAQYALGIDLVDTVPPNVTATSLPAPGATSSAVTDRFTVSFSKDMGAAAVNNLANYDLRGAGPDGLFGTADDVASHLAGPGYASG